MSNFRTLALSNFRTSSDCPNVGRSVRRKSVFNFRTLALSNFRTSSKGFTLFEIIAVLTVISIALTVVLASYTSWATVHALDGAARTLEAGLLHARTSAKAKSTYVMFFYETTGTGSAGSSVKLISWFQSFVCTNDVDRTIITETLDKCSEFECIGAECDIDPEIDSIFNRQFIPLMPEQRLTGHIVLGYVPERYVLDIKEDDFPSGSRGLIIFCPDGSVWGWNDRSEHHIVISTRKLFARDNTSSRPLRRILRVNLATGATTTLRPEQLP